MTNTKHTPGPWVAQFKNTSIPDCITADITPHGDKYRGDVSRLQSCEHINGITQDEMQANAHLIAAAPDLLEALDDLWSWVRNWSPDFMDDDEFDSSIYEAAIAKAKGQT